MTSVSAPEVRTGARRAEASYARASRRGPGDHAGDGYSSATLTPTDRDRRVAGPINGAGVREHPAPGTRLSANQAGCEGKAIHAPGSSKEEDHRWPHR